MPDCQSFLGWFYSVAWVDVFRAVSDLLVGVAWPAAIVLLASIFRREIRKKFGDLATAGPAGFTFNLQQRQPDDLRELVVAVDTDRPSQRLVKDSIVRDLENIQEGKRITVLVNALTTARLGRHLEGIYSVIFGSQIRGLFLLASRDGITSLTEAEKYFEQVKSEHPAFYANATFDQWFNYIWTSELARKDGETITITELGREFLVFVGQTKSGRTMPF